MMFLHKNVIEFVLTILISFITVVSCSKLQEIQVARWAERIGNELWQLGEVTTKFKEIQGRYLYFNAQVERKELTSLIGEVAHDIERMMDRKSDAIKCICDEAEKAAENATYINATYETYYYYSSKYSNVSDDDTKVELPMAIKNNEEMYLTMQLNEDTHFYNLPVDTDRSSVHVPTNIYDRHEDAAFAIQWSEQLDKVFVQNYKSDPALSWQYFGSATGIMRHYPAKKWHGDITKDEFDCRVRTWYIEAATCTKDVIILVDNSGSMDGMGRHIAALTVTTILDTFSNNDYINILYYNNETTNYSIPCFKDSLVQATPENIKLFKEAVGEFSPSGKTDLPQSLQMAFEILENYRIKRKCNMRGLDENGKSKACNQAIMLITDGIMRNLSDIVMRNNYLENGTFIPVRIFTYLIGKEVTNVDEIRWMACANRGYYVQVTTLEQVISAVLQYINVIARPLVLQEHDHPISWTHAYIDQTYDDTKDNQINISYRLLTSAAVPAFDQKSNKYIEGKNGRVANLLGVAGTDVPIDDIEKLTLPYKLGVNAYAFIVSNNGYVLMHRDFRPMFEGHLRKNYNSIDLVEVEQFDEELGPRKISEQLKKLREQMVLGYNGSMYDIPIKYHYDNMRRVTRDKYNFYYVPLNQTPFSLGFAVPDGYGHYSLHVEDVIKNDRYKPDVKITDYFAGSNWKIHPKWVYCKYHYLEGHEFISPEKEIEHFLGKVVNEDDFKWEKQYQGDDSEKLFEVDCGRITHGQDDYYCDEDLVQRLVFDAKNTYEAFRTSSWEDTDQWFKAFNATLRFVATMSGLTRWEYISEEVENNTKIKFGDLHSRAIDETWYRSAVIQHTYDSDSFVYSVPFDSQDENEMLITGSYAVFPSDAGAEAPGCVVGFQFAHSNFVKIVQKMTSNHSIECKDCATCSTDLTCYIIDNNGYIIVSDESSDTGTFFGEVESDIMESMVDRNIFEKVTIYDYQAVCNTKDDETSDAGVLLTPINYIKMFTHWCFMKISWLALEMNIYNLWAPVYNLAQEITNGDSNADEKKKDEPNQFYDCEKYRNLYVLKQESFLHDNVPGYISGSNSRTYYIKKIPHSNLIFLAINDTLPATKSHYFRQRYMHSTKPSKIEYETSAYACQKLELNNLPRRRLAGCYNEHPKESEIKVCSTSSKLEVTHLGIVLCILQLIRHYL